MATSRDKGDLPTGKYSRPSRTDPSLRFVAHRRGRRNVGLRFQRPYRGPGLGGRSHRSGARRVVSGRAVAHAHDRRCGGRGCAPPGFYLQAHFPDVASIADISPRCGGRAQRQGEKSRWPGNGEPEPCSAVGVPETSGDDQTRHASQKHQSPRKRLPQNDAYSAAEFARIRAAAKGQVRQATARIDANLATLRNYRHSGDTSIRIMKTHRGVVWTAGSALDHLSSTGMMPSNYSARAAVAKAAFELQRQRDLSPQAIYPSIAKSTVSWCFWFVNAASIYP